MYTSHQRLSYSYPHHTRYPQHTNTPTPSHRCFQHTTTPTQSHQISSAHKHTYPHHTRCHQHTTRATFITQTPYSLVQLPKLHQISTLSMHPQLPTSHQMHSAHSHSYLHRLKLLGLTTYLDGRVLTCGLLTYKSHPMPKE